MRRLLSLVFLIALIAAAHPAHAVTTNIILTTYPGGGVNTGTTITGMYMDILLPKFPANASTASGFQTRFQISSVGSGNQTPYNFVYFDVTRVVTLNVPNSMHYQIEVSYQLIDNSGLHEGFLTGSGYPGDSIDWFYNDNGSSNTARIVNNGASGHGTFDRSGSWSWTADPHPNLYVVPVVDWHVGTTFGLLGPECVSDMPAQDVPGSSSHVSTLNMLAYVVTSAGRTDLVAGPPTPVTTVSPTTCNVVVTTGTYGPYTTNIITSYGGG